MAQVLCIQLSQGHGLSTPGVRTSFSQELGDMEGEVGLTLSSGETELPPVFLGGVGGGGTEQPTE